MSHFESNAPVMYDFLMKNRRRSDLKVITKSSKATNFRMYHGVESVYQPNLQSQLNVMPCTNRRQFMSPITHPFLTNFQPARFLISAAQPTCNHFHCTTIKEAASMLTQRIRPQKYPTTGFRLSLGAGFWCLVGFGSVYLS